MLYVLLKRCLDPVVFILIILGIGVIVSFKRREKGYSRNILLSAFLLFYISSITPLPNMLCYFLEKDYLLKHEYGIGKLDIVVVLGGGISENKYIKETMPSLETASRLIYGVQVFRSSGAKFIVFAGKGAGILSEAEVMGRAAERLGVPPNNIKTDPNSINTWEHPIEIGKMFPDKIKKIGIVTSAYHMKRSEKEFKKYFSDIKPLPSEYLYSSSPMSIYTFFPNSANLWKCSTALRELVGIGWYKIKGL